MTTNPSYSHQNMAALKTRLIEQLPRLIECLFAGRNICRMAHEYRIGNQGSISIRLADGSYFNHESGEGGDIITLIKHMLKTDFKGALIWARGFIGHSAELSPIVHPHKLQPKIDERAVRQWDKALAMVKRATPIRNTLADAYLRGKRGITIEHLPLPLGFISHAYNYTVGGFYPAMIAVMRDLEGNPIAAHCTFLDPKTGDKLQGSGIKSRLIFGACRGGAIRLAAATERLALCEGIEDGLSILQCSPVWPVWATGGTSGLRAVQIPRHVREVMICADRDEAGVQAANDISARLIKEGKKVRIAMPPEGVKDFNDLLLRGNGHAE